MNEKYGSSEGSGQIPHQSQSSDPGRDAQNAAHSDASEPGQVGSDEVEQLRTDNADLKDRLLRALAEVENTRRRLGREVADASKYAISKFARDMIGVADNIERAMASVPRDVRERDVAVAALLQGIELTARELRASLEKNGIEKLDPVGRRFDPNFHEAMFEVVDPTVPSGTVAEVLEPGYSIASRPLRPAKVVVTRETPPG